MIEHDRTETGNAPADRRVAVIVPALNQVDNIDLLLGAILAQSGLVADLEILVADAGSTDGTVERVRAWEPRAPVRLIVGDERRGMAGDIVTAARAATSAVVVVMGADFRHPPESIADLVRPIVEGEHEMAVGSRYVSGGGTSDFSSRRRFWSRCARVLVWPLTDLTDPMSGFFAVRRDRLLALERGSAGVTTALGVVAAGGDGLRVVEVPYFFRDRARGRSKFGLLPLTAYCKQWIALAGGSVLRGSAKSLAAVVLPGLVADFLAFQLLFWLGLNLAAAHIASFALVAMSNSFANARWACTRNVEPRGSFERRQLRFVAICLMALFLRGGVLSVATDIWGLPPETAIVFGIAAGAMVQWLGNAFYVFPSAASTGPSVRWCVTALGVLLYVLALRLAFLGAVDLLPEEAYYWNYAQHLDIGYLDHPPMVAWLIWAGTRLFRDTEFAVRLGAYLSWLAAAFFCFALARNLYGKTAAFVAVLLFAGLPFFFAIGMVMTPDAPLTAAWAGALYFLERALLGERRAAWWGVGICVGFGLLSKYTIGLLGFAALLFLAVDPRSRMWFRRPWPYAAAVIAAVIFSPVILWNASHNWASFVFQGPHRLRSPLRFSVAHLLASVLVLVTPVGFAAILDSLIRRPGAFSEGRPRADDRRALFVATFTLAPLSVFVVYSFFHGVKLDWTGPLWLAMLPTLAAGITVEGQARAERPNALRRAWGPTIVTLLVAYGAGLHYLALGLPGVGYSANLSVLPVAWKEFGRQAALIEQEVEWLTGEEPLRVGLDKYFLSSQMAFYDPVDNDGAANTAGRSLFGRDSLMYDHWFPAHRQQGRTVILFALNPQDLLSGSVAAQFGYLDPVREQVIYKKTVQAGRFYYRVGYNYRTG